MSCFIFFILPTFVPRYTTNYLDVSFYNIYFGDRDPELPYYYLIDASGLIKIRIYKLNLATYGLTN
jgi:hypothetical protein